MRRFSKLSIILSHEGPEDSVFNPIAVEMTNGTRSIEIADFQTALNILPQGSEVVVIASGTVGNKTMHNIARIIKENLVYVHLDLSAVTELSKIFDSPFQGNTNLRSIIFPKNLESISPTAFAGCTSLRSVIIPSTVNKIGINAFLNCNSLTNLEFKGPYGWYCKSKEDDIPIVNVAHPEQNPIHFSSRKGKFYGCYLYKPLNLQSVKEIC